MRRGKSPIPAFDRVMRRVVVDADTGCWLFTGSTNAGGYGQIELPPENGHRRGTTTHRVVYETLVGPVPSGLELDHVRERGCRHRHCCNPAHLEPVTSRENTLRGDGPAAQRARQTHCKRGHDLNDPTVAYRNRHGQRVCRWCRNIRKGIWSWEP